MKVALFSDIHGNSIALKKVLTEVKKQNVRKLLIMGDFVGYYYNHAEVFRLLEKFDWDAVQGNHDLMLKNFIQKKQKSVAKYQSLFGSSLDWALKNLSKNQINLLLSLPKTKKLLIDGKKILLCHGSPWNQNDYIYPDANEGIFKKIAELGYDFVILGNTHYPLMKKVDKTMIINPGSVGQPRDYGSLASWAIVDFKKNKVTFYRTKFDSAKIVKQARTIDPENQYLWEVLLRKKSAYL